MEKLKLFINSATEKQLRNFGILLTLKLDEIFNNDVLRPYFSVMLLHFKELNKPNLLLLYEIRTDLTKDDEIILHLLYSLYTDIYMRQSIKTCFTNACECYNIDIELFDDVVKAA